MWKLALNNQKLAFLIFRRPNFPFLLDYNADVRPLSSTILATSGCDKISPVANRSNNSLLQPVSRSKISNWTYRNVKSSIWRPQLFSLSNWSCNWDNHHHLKTYISVNYRLKFTHRKITSLSIWCYFRFGPVAGIIKRAGIFVSVRRKKTAPKRHNKSAAKK